MPAAVTVTYNRTPSATLKKMVSGTKSGLEKGVRVWHRVMMPQHFTVSGGKKYGYQPRSGDNEPPRLLKYTRRNQHSQYAWTTVANWHYSWRKRRRKRHNKPLVWSGASEAAAKSAVKISSRKSKLGLIEGRAAMPMLPKYFWQRRKDHNAPDKPNELTRTIPQELDALGEVVRREAQREMGVRPQKQTVKLK